MLPILERLLESQKWLDTLGAPLQQYITALFQNAGDEGKRVKNALNGTWLGHPLHPVLTDVPVGAWTCTFVFDTLGALRGDDTLESAADIALTTGLLGGVGSAVSGWTDWSDTYGKERSVGLLHGLTMAATIAAYTGSLLARRSGARKSGVLLSNLGFGLLSAGAYLGGDEVYDLGYGINHTAFQHGPGDFTPVLPESELPSEQPTKAQADSVSVVLVRQGGEIYALDDTCTHAGCSLAGGRVNGRSIVCPCHGSQFDLRNGAVVNGPATMPEPRYAVRVRDGMIEVKQA